MTFFVETLIHIFGVCFRAGRGFRWWYCRSNKDKTAKLKHARKVSVKRFAASEASENLKQCSGGATFWVGGWPVVQVQPLVVQHFVCRGMNGGLFLLLFFQCRMFWYTSFIFPTYLHIYYVLATYGISKFFYGTATGLNE